MSAATSLTARFPAGPTAARAPPPRHRAPAPAARRAARGARSVRACDGPIWRQSWGGVDTMDLNRDDDQAQIEADAAWLGAMVRLWLNEEWSELACHADIGAEVARIFRHARMEGNHEIQDVLVSLTTELQAFDFYDSFTDAFSVSNKCVELLMMRAGVDCGCSSEADRTCIERYEAQLAEEGPEA